MKVNSNSPFAIFYGFTHAYTIGFQKSGAKVGKVG